MWSPMPRTKLFLSEDCEKNVSKKRKHFRTHRSESHNITAEHEAFKDTRRFGILSPEFPNFRNGSITGNCSQTLASNSPHSQVLAPTPSALEFPSESISNTRRTFSLEVPSPVPILNDLVGQDICNTGWKSNFRWLRIDRRSFWIVTRMRIRLVNGVATLRLNSLMIWKALLLEKLL